MERLLQALDELDDLVTMLRHLWIGRGISLPAAAPLESQPQPRPVPASALVSAT